MDAKQQILEIKFFALLGLAQDAAQPLLRPNQCEK
jgi:hypothetical protein